MLDETMFKFDPDTRAVMIAKPILPGFLRGRLHRLGYTCPFDYLDNVITARKSGFDLAVFYDTWDNNIDQNIITSQEQLNEMAFARDELLRIFTDYLNSNPLTTWLLHLEIQQIEEHPDGLVIYYKPDEQQYESTFKYGNLPYGYDPYIFGQQR